MLKLEEGYYLAYYDGNTYKHHSTVWLKLDDIKSISKNKENIGSYNNVWVYKFYMNSNSYWIFAPKDVTKFEESFVNFNKVNVNRSELDVIISHLETIMTVIGMRSPTDDNLTWDDLASKRQKI